MIQQLVFSNEHKQIISELEQQCFGSGAIDQWVISPFLINGLVFGFFHKNELSGIAELIPSIHEKNSVFLFSFMLMPELRGKKLSYTFLKELGDELHHRGFKKLSLTVSEDNIPAWKLYSTYQFKKQQFIEHIYGKNEHRWLISATLPLCV